MNHTHFRNIIYKDDRSVRDVTRCIRWIWSPKAHKAQTEITVCSLHTLLVEKKINFHFAFVQSGRWSDRRTPRDEPVTLLVCHLFESLPNMIWGLFKSEEQSPHLWHFWFLSISVLALEIRDGWGGTLCPRPGKVLAPGVGLCYYIIAPRHWGSTPPTHTHTHSKRIRWPSNLWNLVCDQTFRLC